jgi:hypothetical protein
MGGPGSGRKKGSGGGKIKVRKFDEDLASRSQRSAVKKAGKVFRKRQSMGLENPNK